MRILMVIHQFFPRYTTGTEVIAFEVATRFQHLGHDVRILTAESMPASQRETLPVIYREDYQSLHVDRVPYDVDRETKQMHNEAFDPEAYALVSNYLRTDRPDVVQVMHQQRWSTAVVHAAKDLGIPVVFTVTDFWSICHNHKLLGHDGTICDGPDRRATNCLQCFTASHRPHLELPIWLIRVLTRVANWIPRRWRRRSTVIQPGLDAKRIALNLLKTATSLQDRPAIQRAMLSRCDRVVAPTQWTAQLIAREGVPAQRLLMLPYGLNDRNTRGYQFKTPNPAFRFGYVGQMAPHKGVMHVVRAFRALLVENPNRPIELHLHGDERWQPIYCQQLRESADGCESIFFHGLFAHDQIGEVMTNLDAMVCASVWYENFPMAVNEAFATRTPVIASDLGGLSTVVHNERNGLLFPMADEAALTAQMLRLVNEPGLWERLRDGIGPMKTIEQSADEYLDIYRSLAA